MARVFYYALISVAVVLFLAVLGAPWVLVAGYVLAAVVGAAFLVRDILRKRAIRELIEEGTVHILARLERAGAAAAEMKQQSWYADAVVDLEEVARRAFVAKEVMLPAETLIIPNPYFVLPLPALVKWGFATSREIAEAVRWANAPEPPLRWRNPPLVRDLRLMGWPEREAYARVGLFLWSMEDSKNHRPEAEEYARQHGIMYDVPRPPAE